MRHLHTPRETVQAGHTSHGLHSGRRASSEKATALWDFLVWLSLPCRGTGESSGPHLVFQLLLLGRSLGGTFKTWQQFQIDFSMNVMTASGSDGVTIGSHYCLRPAGRLPIMSCFLSLWPLLAECGQLWATPSFLHSM